MKCILKLIPSCEDCKRKTENKYGYPLCDAGKLMVKGVVLLEENDVWYPEIPQWCPLSEMELEGTVDVRV